mgnify:FL=1
MQVEEVKVGQRVRYVGAITAIVGLIGTCVYIDTNRWVAVAFDSPLEVLHACEGHCKDNYGWWCKAEDLELAESETGENTSQSVVQIDNLKRTIKELFSLGLSGQDVVEVVGAICKAHFAEEGLEKRIVTLKEKVVRCLN